MIKFVKVKFRFNVQHTKRNFVHCRSNKKAIVTCDEGYRIDGIGTDKISSVSCVDGNWQSDDESNLAGEKICQPYCGGGCGQGICVAPNTCKCNDDYVGQMCETLMCKDSAPLVANGSFPGRYVSI